MRVYLLRSEIGMVILSTERQKIKWAMKGKKERYCLLSRIQPEIKPIYKHVCSSNKIKIQGLFHVMTACWLPLHMHSLCHSVHRMNQNQGHTNDHNIWHHQYDLQRTFLSFWKRPFLWAVNQILPDAVVLFVPAPIVQRLLVIHPRRSKNCSSKKETLQCLNSQL